MIPRCSRVGFLHTSKTHVATFNSLIDELAPELEPVHLVRADLLNAAVRDGAASVMEETRAALATFVDCKLLVCTCSTLGSLVEGLTIGESPVMRIDRALGDAAVRFDRVLVVAALESAGKAANQLLEGSSSNTNVTWDTAIVPDAWRLFEDGRQAAYEAVISAFVNQTPEVYDAVVLSQASMMGAAVNCDRPNILTSPRLGVLSIVKQLEASE
jgi:hypothetical protein